MKMPCLHLNWLTFRQGLRKRSCLGLPVPPRQSLPFPFIKVCMAGRAGRRALTS